MIRHSGELLCPGVHPVAELSSSYNIVFDYVQPNSALLFSFFIIPNYYILWFWFHLSLSISLCLALFLSLSLCLMFYVSSFLCVSDSVLSCLVLGCSFDTLFSLFYLFFLPEFFFFFTFFFTSSWLRMVSKWTTGSFLLLRLSSFLF